MTKWINKDLKYLEHAIADEWVDYYPSNMHDVGNKPVVMKMREAVPRFRGPSGTGLPRYMQIRLSVKGWKTLERDLFPYDRTADSHYLPSSMWTEEHWIDQCISEEDDVDNFYRVNQWNMLLIGEAGTGIFLHHDHLAASSWQGHVSGRKAWVICPYDQKPFLHAKLHPWSVDYNKEPQYAKAYCGRVLAHPGELLYYPAYWWHSTKMLDPLTIGVTGLMVGVEDSRNDIAFEVHDQFFKDLMIKCNKPGEDISLKWPGAAPPISKGVCAALPMCLELWRAKAQALGLSVYTTKDPYANHLAKARLFEGGNQLEKALASYRAAVKLDSNNLDTWRALVALLDRKDFPPQTGASLESNQKLRKIAQQRLAKAAEREL